MSTKSKKPTGKVAQTITAVKKEPVKKAVAEKKPKPASKPARPKSTPKKNTSAKPNVSKPEKAVTKPVKPVPQKSPVFCVHDLKANQFVPVKGARAISIPGFDGIQLFLHKGTNDYRISEASSGGLVATGNRQKVAVQMATDTLNNHGRQKVLESIQKSIDRMGMVPGFGPPDGCRPPEGVKASGKPTKDEPKEVFKVTTDDGKEIEVTYTPGFMQHIEFRGEISSTGYHSHFGYKGELANVHEAARKKANELRAAFLKEQARLARKAMKDAPQSPQVTTRLKSKILAALVDGKKLPRPQAHFDEIVKLSGAEVADVSAALLMLELTGAVKSLPGKNYRMPTAEEQAAAKPKSATPFGEGGNRGGKPAQCLGSHNRDQARPEHDRFATAPKRDNAGRGSRLSMLDAAAEILKEAKEPLCCKDISRAIFEKKLAESGGRTPHATLSAAIGREITARGKGSRFRRAGRGLFAYNS